MKKQRILIMGAAFRHPMPYGDLTKQIVQRFADYADLDTHECTIEGASPLFVDDPGVILYWLWDFLTFLGGSVLLSSLITQRFGVMGFVLAMQLHLALYGVWLLRKYRHQTPAPLYPVDA